MVRSHSVLATFFILGLVFVFSSCFSLTTARNASAASTLTVTVADTISLDIMPKSASGTFAHSSTSADTVTVMTDNYTGYTLGIAASTANDNALSYKVNDAVVDTIASHTNTSGVSESNYANDSYASLNSLNNTWGYRPSTYYDTTNNTNVDNTSTNLYFPAPTSTSVNTLAKTTTANLSTADNYNIAIGARVGIDKTPGAYTNTLVITVVANATPYSLTYDANAGGDSTVANMPSGVLGGTSYADTITLSSTVPTRTGYTFAGWCATNTSQTSCSGTLYNSTNNNLDSFPIDRTASSNSLNAYAIWTVNTYSLAITFAGSGVSSVKVCEVAGDCSGTDLRGTISTSEGSVSNLAYSTAYYLYPAFTSGYELDSWSKTDSTTGAVLSSTSDNNPTYTMGEGNGAITITGKVSGYAYSLTFNGNGGTPSSSSLSGTALSVTLPTATYRQSSRATLLGWSESATATTATYSDTMAITAETTKTLYAIWSFNSGTLQNTSTACGNNMVDARTGVSYLTYTISGKCYMEQNLYLPTGFTLYPSDSNITRTSWTTPTASFTAGSSYTEARMVAGTHANNTYNATGGWYNYCAASAGTVCSQTQANASEDICPAGWRLPTSGEMTNVKNANRSNWKFYAGYYFSSSLLNASSNSIWWSATASTANYQYYLYYIGGSLGPGANYKSNGYFVRCVRK